jgi:uncharacterized protein with HEPN domain
VKRRVIDFLEDILNECAYLMGRSRGMTYQDFVDNEDLKRAFLRSLEIIGEASKKVSMHIGRRYPEINWRDIAGMRDKLAHDYFGIDYEVVWKTIIEDIPTLFLQMKVVLEKESMDAK